MVKVRILNETGHTELQLEVQEVIEQIDTHPTHWVLLMVKWLAVNLSMKSIGMQ